MPAGPEDTARTQHEQCHLLAGNPHQQGTQLMLPGRITKTRCANLKTLNAAEYDALLVCTVLKPKVNLTRGP